MRVVQLGTVRAHAAESAAGNAAAASAAAAGRASGIPGTTATVAYGGGRAEAGHAALQEDETGQDRHIAPGADICKSQTLKRARAVHVTAC